MAGCYILSTGMLSENASVPPSERVTERLAADLPNAEELAASCLMVTSRSILACEREASRPALVGTTLVDQIEVENVERSIL